MKYLVHRSVYKVPYKRKYRYLQHDLTRFLPQRASPLVVREGRGCCLKASGHFLPCFLPLLLCICCCCTPYSLCTPLPRSTFYSSPSSLSLLSSQLSPNSLLTNFQPHYRITLSLNSYPNFGTPSRTLSPASPPCLKSGDPITPRPLTHRR